MMMREWMVAALLVMGLGITARAEAQAGNEWIERWLFLGRHTDSGWQPPAFSIAPPAYPVKPGNRVVVRRHALVYGAVDCKVVDVADFKPGEDAAPGAVELVRAGEQGLEISGPAIECPSVCGAKTVWVSVRIPAARLIRIEP